LTNSNGFGEQSDSGEHNNQTIYPALRHNVQDINVYSALQRLWTRRRLIGLWTAMCVAGGILIVLGSRREYQASTALLPEQNSEQQGGGFGTGLLSQFGSLLGGADLSGLAGTESALTFDLYPDILESTPVQMNLLQTPVTLTSSGSQMTLGTYLDEHVPFSIWDLPGDAMGGMMRIIRGDTDNAHHAARGDSTILAMSAREVRLTSELEERIDVEFDETAGTLSISVKMPDPQVAAQTARAAVEQLTSYVTHYRLNKLSKDLVFLEGRLAEARTQFEAASRALASFRDRNLNLARDLSRTEEQRLEAEFEVAYGVYSSLVSQVEEARIHVQKETPVFQTLEPVQIPHQKSSPQTSLILVLVFLLGIITSTIYVLLEKDVRAIGWMLRQPERKEAESNVGA
jgi:uncharacterized protein involved in exopolysaccharide biosynthesis